MLDTTALRDLGAAFDIQSLKGDISHCTPDFHSSRNGMYRLLGLSTVIKTSQQSIDKKAILPVNL